MHLEPGRQSLNIFDDFFVQIRHPPLEAVGHRELIAVHQQLVGKSRSHFEELETAQLIRLAHQRQQILPAFEQLIARVPIEQAVMKQRVNLIPGQQR